MLSNKETPSDEMVPSKVEKRSNIVKPTSNEGELKGIVSNVQRFSIHDGGGIRTVAFLKGCPFRCPWCCNPENLSFEPQVWWRKSLCMHCSMREDGNGLLDCPRTVQECPTAAKEVVGRAYTVSELADKLVRDRAFFGDEGGITLSGGECLAGKNQPFSLAVLKECKRRGARTAIETTLAVPLENVEELVAAVDTFLVDFKIADPQESRRVTGIDVELRDANLRRVLGLGARVLGRMPIIPGYTDGLACVRANVQRMRELGIPRVDVLPFHQLGEAKYDAVGMDYGLRSQAQLTDADVADVVRLCEEAGLSATVRGA